MCILIPLALPLYHIRSYIVGASALIPYKREDDDVGWFIWQSGRASGIGVHIQIHMALSSNPSFSRAGRADTKTVWEPYRSCADTLLLDYDRCAKEKSRKKKWTE